MTDSSDDSFSSQSISTDDATSDQSFVAEKQADRFPERYIMPPLPHSLIKDIETRALNKFGPRYSNRQILIDAVDHDLIDQYKLL